MKASFLLAVSMSIGLTLASTARAEDPKFQFAPPPPSPASGIKAQVRSGLMLATGNARSVSLSAGAVISSEWGRNRAQGEAEGALTRSQLPIATDADGSGDIGPDELSSITRNVTQMWLVRGRYDRFLTQQSTVYGSARIGSDVPAGKRLNGGAQAGLSYKIYRHDRGEMSAEVGYDFTAESFVVGGGVNIHSLRFFLGATQRISDTSGLSAGCEVLTNVNNEQVPNPFGEPFVGPFGDVRVNSNVQLTVKVMDRVSLAVGLALRYDRVPAPRAPLGLPFTPGFVPLSLPVDFVSDASLRVDIL